MPARCMNKRTGKHGYRLSLIHIQMCIRDRDFAIRNGILKQCTEYQPFYTKPLAASHQTSRQVHSKAIRKQERLLLHTTTTSCEVQVVTRATTGRYDPLQPYLEDAIRRADRMRFIVSFVMESGVKLIIPQLKMAVDRGVQIQLLTGFYLSITEPSALYYLYDQLGSSLSLIHIYCICRCLTSCIETY